MVDQPSQRPELARREVDAVPVEPDTAPIAIEAAAGGGQTLGARENGGDELPGAFQRPERVVTPLQRDEPGAGDAKREVVAAGVPDGAVAATMQDGRVGANARELFTHVHRVGEREDVGGRRCGGRGTLESGEGLALLGSGVRQKDVGESASRDAREPV